MILNSLEFQEYISNEISKIALAEGWENQLEILSENTFIVLSQNDYDVIDCDSLLTTDIDLNIKKINQLNEELKRMRHLVDFRDPFFNKD